MEFLAALAEWPVAAALRRSAWAYPLVNAGHILGIALLLGPVATIDARLLGLLRLDLTVAEPVLRRVAAAGLLLALATGALLFSVRPISYAGNPAFVLKLVLLALALANAAVLLRTAAWRGVAAGGSVPPGVRLAALGSLMAWIAALVAGRWIGFVE